MKMRSKSIAEQGRCFGMRQATLPELLVVDKRFVAVMGNLVGEKGKQTEENSSGQLELTQVASAVQGFWLGDRKVRS